eukprot:237540-Amphidinium_carterae.1
MHAHVSTDATDSSLCDGGRSAGCALVSARCCHLSHDHSRLQGSQVRVRTVRVNGCLALLHWWACWVIVAQCRAKTALLDSGPVIYLAAV